MQGFFRSLLLSSFLPFFIICSCIHILRNYWPKRSISLSFHFRFPSLKIYVVLMIREFLSISLKCLCSPSNLINPWIIPSISWVRAMKRRPALCCVPVVIIREINLWVLCTDAFKSSTECKLSPVRSIGDNDFLRVISWACWYYHPLLVLVNYLLCYVAIYIC